MIIYFLFGGTCRRVGIGRRGRLKICWRQRRAGSSPAAGIIKHSEMLIKSIFGCFCLSEKAISCHHLFSSAYTIKKYSGIVMKPCSHLFFLSSLACKLFECFDEKELTVLSADLMALGDLLASLIARKEC